MIIPVKLSNDSYNIILERGALARAGEIFDLDRKVLVVTDDGVPEAYAVAVADAAAEGYILTLEAGEASKNLQEFEKILRKMLELGFTRKDCVVAAGGGVVGDLAGFAAACYMRGVDFYNVPTTLLSQVDSSVGGKTAVDLAGIKNIVGAFHQPKAVLADPDVLTTLDERQMACGCAEIIKIAAALDKEFFENLEACGVRKDLESAIGRAIALKAKVVESDEKETGLRKVLNFGHTLGHGIESVTDLLHGECVALGMLPMCSPDVRTRIGNMLEREGLPVTCSADAKAVAEAAMHDKKAEGGAVLTVRVEEAGTFSLVKADEQQLVQYFEEVFGK